MTTVPQGYTIWREGIESLVVAITDFSLMGRESVESFSYKGSTWVRGPLEIIPDELAGKVCSMRTYNLLLSA